MFTHASMEALAGGEFFTRLTYKIIYSDNIKNVDELMKLMEQSVAEMEKDRRHFCSAQLKKGYTKYVEATDPKRPLYEEEFVDELAATSMARLWDVGKTEPIKVGKASPTEGTMPSSIYIILKYLDDPVMAFKANAMVGGDNAARSIPIGMVLGAYHGASAIPAELRS